MAQERIGIEGTEWLRELRAALDDVLIDVRCVAEGDGYDFLLVHSSGNDRAALERFTTAFARASDIPPFDLISFEDGHVPKHYGDYWSLALAPAHAD